MIHRHLGGPFHKGVAIKIPSVVLLKIKYLVVHSTYKKHRRIHNKNQELFVQETLDCVTKHLPLNACYNLHTLDKKTFLVIEFTTTRQISYDRDGNRTEGLRILQNKQQGAEGILNKRRHHFDQTVPSVICLTK